MDAGKEKTPMIAGSFQNLVAGTDPEIVPTVGMGATEIMWTDRNPFTVIRVVSPITIVVQADAYKRVDKNGMSECQDYQFSPNPDGELVTLRKNSRGQWGNKRRRFAIGERDRYHDFSF